MNRSCGAAVVRNSLYLLLILATLCGHAARAELLRFGGSSSASHSKFLQADQAFQMDAEATADGAILHFHITPGYYLYHDRFHFDAQGSSLTLAKPQFAHEGQWKDDPNFGRVQVYHEDIDVTLKATGSGEVKVSWQGCADAGLCYPPQKQTITVSGKTAAPAANPAPAAAEASGTATAATVPAAPAEASATPSAVTPAPSNVSSSSATPATATLPGFLQTDNKLLLLAGLFALGLTLSLTPCMWPMVPILAGIIARQHTRSALRGFLLSLSYVVGFASTYALAGLLVSIFGKQINLPIWFQQPIVLGVFALLFVLLSLSMFGLYELQLPHSLQNRLHGLSHGKQGGRYISTYIMGFFSALVVSPCVTGPLIGVLAYISTTGNAFFGTVALFVLGMAMGVPLLIMGTTEGSILPKSGDWMHKIKILMGLLLLGVAIALLGRILPGPVTLVLWALLATVSGVWLGALEPAPSGPRVVAKGIGVFFLIYALVLMAGAASNNDDPLQPLLRFGQHAEAASTASFRPIKSNADLDAALQQAAADHKTVMLDFYASWCTSCKTMERETFTNPKVSASLDKLVLLRADVTRNDADDQALMKRLGIYGPPAILFFAKQQELTGARIDGEMNADKFLAHLSAHVLQGE